MGYAVGSLVHLGQILRTTQTTGRQVIDLGSQDVTIFDDTDAQNLRRFVEEFGEERVRDTPLSELGFVGAAVGAAMTGLRPIVDFTIASFVYVAMDQMISQAAKSRF